MPTRQYFRSVSSLFVVVYVTFTKPCQASLHIYLKDRSHSRPRYTTSHQIGALPSVCLAQTPENSACRHWGLNLGAIVSLGFEPGGYCVTGV